MSGSALDPRNNIFYQRGYADGLKDGYNKALEGIPELIARVSTPVQIRVTDEQMASITKYLKKE